MVYIYYVKKIRSYAVDIECALDNIDVFRSTSEVRLMNLFISDSQYTVSNIDLAPSNKKLIYFRLSE